MIGARGAHATVRSGACSYFSAAPIRTTSRGAALAALADPALVHLKVDLVVGANNPHRDRLADRVAGRPGAALHGPRPHLADLMSEADLAIGAGGATTWERCCLGLPSLVVSIAENQRPACAALAVAGVIQYLGHRIR